jgi:hypothetical protein
MKLSRKVLKPRHRVEIPSIIGIFGHAIAGSFLSEPNPATAR